MPASANYPGKCTGLQFNASDWEAERKNEWMNWSGRWSAESHRSNADMRRKKLLWSQKFQLIPWNTQCTVDITGTHIYSIYIYISCGLISLRFYSCHILISWPIKIYVKIPKISKGLYQNYSTLPSSCETKDKPNKCSDEVILVMGSLFSFKYFLLLHVCVLM